MNLNTKRRAIGWFTCGMILGGLLVYSAGITMPSTHAAQEQTQTPAQPPDVAATLAAMQADVAHLKEVVPSQSHSMADVAYHFSNLWFAAKQRNWPLATFYLAEARQHIRWTIRIRPVRRLGSNPVDLVPIFDAIDNGVMTSLKASIDEKDLDKFQANYKRTLTACYGCHQAAGLTFLRPVIPSAPAQTIISFDPLPTE